MAPNDRCSSECNNNELGSNFIRQLVEAIIKYRRKINSCLRMFLPSFMSAFVMDAVCFSSKFTKMGCKCIVQDPLPIHMYHNILWEYQFNSHFYKIHKGIMLPIHKEVYNRATPRFYKEAEVDILSVYRWFSEETFTYITVFGSIASLHLLWYYFLNKLMAKEIASQIGEVGGLSIGLEM